ncbi:hypothetical protein BUALT_Bualt19G0038300 [Buddleja alternifolia]|uniref:Uncharacterized protein n=1 Tax=Buddleja alternifolia TaxID=168488 RepID=A0AAV6W1N0_9LAMI|nr:hypothetical protein BUALT_Bualt19G0038300 [Buddleja alternifolia]
MLLAKITIVLPLNAKSIGFQDSRFEAGLTLPILRSPLNYAKGTAMQDASYIDLGKSKLIMGTTSDHWVDFVGSVSILSVPSPTTDAITLPPVSNEVATTASHPQATYPLSATVASSSSANLPENGLHAALSLLQSLLF